MANSLKLKLVRSPYGRPEKQRKVLASLGLTRMNRVRELPDNPAIQGMIFKVQHLVQIVD
ncbi:MAG: 50S ribosomal protein L30 [Magnetococcales bacterium]|nr:50S ribosomal protein L30 [Magnetococcales bacterium]